MTALQTHGPTDIDRLGREAKKHLEMAAEYMRYGAGEGMSDPSLSGRVYRRSSSVQGQVAGLVAAIRKDAKELNRAAKSLEIFFSEVSR